MLQVIKKETNKHICTKHEYVDKEKYILTNIAHVTPLKLKGKGKYPLDAIFYKQ